jgi:hypothetical protein
MIKSIQILILVILVSTHSIDNYAASFGGLKSKLGVGKNDTEKPADEEGVPSLDSLVETQSGIVKTLVAGLQDYAAGQAQVAKSLGLKEEVDKLESEQEALASGNVNDKSSIDKSMKITSSAQKAIDKKIAEGGTLSAESKVEFAKALPFYAKGTLNTIKLLPEVKDWGTSASSVIKSAGLMNAGKLKSKLDTGLFIVSKLPKYMKTAKKRNGSLMAFSKKNEIDTSKADELLGDDF